MKWFRNLKIRAKLLLSFLLVALIGAGIGFVGYTSLSNMKTTMDDITDFRMVATYALDGILQGQLDVVVGARGLLNPLLSDIRDDSYVRLEAGFAMIDEAWSDYEVLPLGDFQRNLFERLQGEWADWEESMNYLLAICEDIDQLLASGADIDDPEVALEFERAIAHYANEITPKRAKTESTLNEMVERNELMVAEDKSGAAETYSFSLILLLSFIGAGVFLAILLGVVVANLISKPINQLANYADLMADGHVNLDFTADSKDEIGDLVTHFGVVLDSIKEQVRLLEAVSIGDLEVEIKPRSDEDVMAFSLQNLVQASKEQAALAQSLAEGDFSVEVKPRSDKDELSKAINQMVENLKLIIGEVQEATEQVAAAAEQISSGSQAVAEGAAEQASPLEEVSSSLEEITSMTRTNAENAGQAQSLSQEASGGAEEGINAMGNMNKAIAEIKDASDETARIIKTIDDIAFQTNLLALNAAVEAARAGEAGRGFAVVSEEVRNLALRSAEAAKDTAAMIEEAIKRADNGVKIAEEVHKSLLKISDGTRKTNEVVAEIAAASQEQARGIDQITVATNQMNKVTQENAASSEESASGAEELASQVDQLRQTMSWFKVEEDNRQVSKKQRLGSKTAQKKHAAADVKSQGKAKKDDRHDDNAGLRPKGKKTHMIPLDDDEEFEDF